MYPIGTLVHFGGGRYEKACYGVVVSIKSTKSEYVVVVGWPLLDTGGGSTSEFYFDPDGNSDFDNKLIRFFGEKNVQ